MIFLISYCRPGFELDCSEELREHIALLVPSMASSIDIKQHFGFVECSFAGSAEPLLLQQRLEFKKLIFSRQCLWCMGKLTELPDKDRVTPIIEQIKNHSSSAQSFQDVWVEHSDSEEGKTLAAFCKSFTHPLRQTLKKQGLLSGGKAVDQPPIYDKNNLQRLHILFTSYSCCYVCFAETTNSSPHYMGIPRLKFPQDAPSRSTLKLEEAFVTFLSKTDELGKTAVDLGAAPGGWSYQLLRRGMTVTAIDNGNLDPQLLANKNLQHFKADGFTWKPRTKIDLLVCDMVEKPIKIADLIKEWFTDDLCRKAIFNLKLPMKKRYAEVKRCLHLLEPVLAHKNLTLRCKQLYHDRDEVTVYVGP